MAGQAGALLNGRDLENPVQVEFHAAQHLVAGRCLGQALNAEASDQDVVQGVQVVALIDRHLPVGLPVDQGVVGIGAADRQRRVAPDNRVVAVLVRPAVQHAEVRRTERVGRDIDQHPVDIVAGLAGGQYPGPKGDTQLGLEVLVGDEAGPVFEQLGNQRGAARAADQQHFVNLVRPPAGVAQRLMDAVQGGVQQMPDQPFVVGPGYFHIEVDRNPVAFGQVRLSNMGVGLKAQALFGRFDRIQQTAHGSGVATQVRAARLDKPVVYPVQQAPVKIIAAQLVVAVAGNDLGDFVLDPDQGHIQRSAAQVINQDRAVSPPVGAIGQGRSGRFVQDTDDLQAGDATGVAGGLALGVGEVGRHGNHRPRYGPVQYGLGAGLQAVQDQG